MEAERFSQFISRVFDTESLELVCSQVQAFLPAFVEAEQDTEDVGALGAAIQSHLRQCPDCTESYLGLAYVVGYEAEWGLPTDATAFAG